MVIGLVGKVANVGIRLGSRYFKQLHQYDVAIHKGLYGQAGGRGVRHGRDAGIFISQYFRGDDITEDAQIHEPEFTPRTVRKTRGGYERRDYRSRSERERRDRRSCRPVRYYRKPMRYR